jgi:putative membrane protein
LQLLLIEKWYSFAGSFENKPTDTPVTAIAQTIDKISIQMVNEYQNEFENQEMIELKSNGSKKMKLTSLL